MRRVPPQISERLRAAADLFAERGLDKSRIDEVAEVTGVPKATLYYYFDGKADILAFLLEDLLQETSRAVSAVAATSKPAAERLEDVIHAQIEIMARRPAVCRALIGELGRAGRMPTIADMINVAYQKPVEALLVAGATDGSLAPQSDPRAASIALFGAVTIGALMYLVNDHRLDGAAVGSALHSVVIEGLRPRREDQ
ncbi:TetR/AcrR family transcriptional regulator [Mycolicibacterium arenosum]|uniref:TetR/AcrR family transcriptional regulator n=1 Tax=Mycolicibacterium arenosum TaxID=2952157 RepID=A0ABT1LW99_9MYCO|nr:TetR/AcrR family transcriptional regulator [Mycolicibacterium sp. CAU 1645]MCP9271174.1 TetR/AcrR family transcriptional regulator [Mycolicibacterium sp. CAU 1645]